MSADNGHGEELARRQRVALLGRRLVLVQELEAGRYLAEAQVKQLTGGDHFTAARLYENEVEVAPTHKLVIGTNCRPLVRGHDHAIWRRIRLVPFLATITEDQKDPQLAAKLRAEAPGILAWLVRGCLDWQREGLAPSRQMRDAAEGYRQAEDRLAEFLADHTAEGDGVEGALLYGRYKAWAIERGERAWTRRALMDALSERGYRIDRFRAGSKQVRGVLGIRLVVAAVGGIAAA
jgi:putative DNA primase/helicase